ncbi:3-oxoacyl-ACP reductase FabG [Kistimonas asteriae]|uniref:3-oxoacyl-ACP reductase FabG n=1 Tax=Kistimonas asteriae TaxID=517724 RepID=UPI001BA6AE87|nr:3-oxoacyl-ACP reductase FabG [Kistimonas asteriae]
MLAPLSGRSVLITGASKGIGKGVANVFAEKGCKVLLAARNEALLSEAVSSIRAGGGTADYCCTDVTDAQAVQAAVDQAVQRFGGLDILCCNAGIFPNTRLKKMTAKDWDTVMDVNVKGMFHAVKSALPPLEKSDQGRIILTSSITGPITGYPGWSHYGASKAAMLGFMRTAAIELASTGITINAILPGNIATEGMTELAEEYMATMKASIPMQKLGSTDDIAYAALFLASREAGFITGQTLVVDGGQVLPESLEAMG